MAGFSLILIFIWFGFVILSTVGALVLLIISLILFLVRGKAQNGRKAKAPVRKGIAITLLVLGCLFLLPLGISACVIAIGAGRGNMEKIQALEEIENKIYVEEDEWKNGFDYDGRELVPVNLFINDEQYRSSGKNQNLQKIGALVMESSASYYTFYQVENHSGYEIYYVKVASFAGGENYSRVFVDKNDYDAVLDYYGDEELSIRALWRTAPEDTGLSSLWESLDVKPDDRGGELFALFHAVLDDVSDRRCVNTSQQGDYECMVLTFESDDGVLFVKLYIYTHEEEMIVYLNDYEVEREIVEEYKEMLFSLIEDAQAELLQK